ncbi:hypothetical protein LCGC14_1541070 [marine sediment metagenome]|uniref:Lipoprotein n=1 Tax=marine sediment metagenome TaxID=412755 RepID=A0A0F9LTS7_9ZZZZ
MMYKLLLVCLLVVIQGCMLGTRNVTLVYSLKDSTTAHAIESVPVIGIVAVRPFLDGRDKKSAIGEVRNNYGGRVSIAVTENNVAEWAMSALEHGLKAQGIRSVPATDTKSGLVVGGELQTVYCVVLFSYVGNVSFLGTIDYDGKRVSEKQYSNEVIFGMNWAATAASYSESLTSALSLSIEDFVADIRQALETKLGS